MNRPLSAPASDVALLIARVTFAVVMFAHGYEKLFVMGIGPTTEGFEKLSIPLAIVSASFVTVLELAGALMILCGALTTIVCGLYLFQFVGAIVFVHGQHGLFIKDNGAEYVMVICAFALVLAAAGPGRFSVDRWLRDRQAQRARELAHMAEAPLVVPDHSSSSVAEPVIAAPRQAAPVYRAAAPAPVVLPPPFAPAPDEDAPSVPAPSSAEQSGPLPVRRARTAHASR
ncbi:DoxX family protein [Pseudonocardia thermophila]|jgi:Predicted membrane protein|uniref:DoxX family protein n=1 Tax=Pseudonocardia thermophila TaxID=1848 RepID=UPI00248D72A1|nr:DoxX family protein [Pseudonocardia thermophila]